MSTVSVRRDALLKHVVYSAVLVEPNLVATLE